MILDKKQFYCAKVSNTIYSRNRRMKEYFLNLARKLTKIGVESILIESRAHGVDIL